MNLRRVLFFLIGCFTIAYADWNQEFDQESYELVASLEDLQGNYIELYEQFISFRDEFLSDSSFWKAFASAKNDDKFIIVFPREGWVVKKRRSQNTCEGLTWELSCLLGVDGMISPAFPVKVGKNSVIVQRLDQFIISEKQTKVPPKTWVKKVSVAEYWKSLLTAYILGFGDLVGRNIGISPEGRVVFFDTESAFHYPKNTHREGSTRVMPTFISQSLDWPQARICLDKDSLQEVHAFVEGLSFFQEKLNTFYRHRSLLFSLEDMLSRIKKVQEFPLLEGESFYDFYAFIEPQIMAGLDELCSLISSILGRKARLGSALMFLARGKDKYTISRKQRQKIEEWVSIYVGD